MSPPSRPPWEVLAGCRVYDLAHSLDEQMPVSPNHPGFRMSLRRRHGDVERADGGSAANELMVLGGHSGTHIDALGHVSHRGELYGGVDAQAAQRGGRLQQRGVEELPLTLSRGVMLDIAALHGVPVLAPATPVTGDDLEAAARRQRVELRPGDVVLVRTGWARYWSEPTRFLGADSGVPGPDVSAARWLVEHRVRLTGGESLAYEHIPAGRGHALLPVHRMLLVEAGIPIIECLRLCELAAAGVSEFLFVLTPLKVTGATGVPVRPVAVAAEPS